MKGVIKRIIYKRGFGFILSERGKDVFFHCSGVLGKFFKGLKIDDQVTFEIEKSKKGLRAKNIELKKEL